MRTVLVWLAVAVAAWCALVAVLVVAILRPSTVRERAERDAYTRATGVEL